jgi:hypothetical protein
MIAATAVMDKVGMTVAIQPLAKAVSALKLPAKEASPTSKTSQEARLSVREKNILNIHPLPILACILSVPGFFAVYFR